MKMIEQKLLEAYKLIIECKWNKMKKEQEHLDNSKEIKKRMKEKDLWFDEWCHTTWRSFKISVDFSRHLILYSKIRPKQEENSLSKTL